MSVNHKVRLAKPGVNAERKGRNEVKRITVSPPHDWNCKLKSVQDAYLERKRRAGGSPPVDPEVELGVESVLQRSHCVVVQHR